MPHVSRSSGRAAGPMVPNTRSEYLCATAAQARWGVIDLDKKLIHTLFTENGNHGASQPGNTTKSRLHITGCSQLPDEREQLVVRFSCWSTQARFWGFDFPIQPIQHNTTAYTQQDQPYSHVTGVCRLCLGEKHEIMFNPGQATLNQRSEFFTHCRHKEMTLLSKVKPKT